MRELQRGRVKQKERTCKAIIEATVAFLRQGITPSIDEVAEAAGLSRATIYRYYGSQEVLLTEATLNISLPDISSILDQPQLADDVEARLEAVLRASHRFVLENETTLRTALRLAMETAGGKQALNDEEREEEQSGRRFKWLHAALEPARERLGRQRFEQLVAALLPYMGVELIYALCDLGGYTREQALEIAWWAARSLLRSSLDQDQAHP